MYVDVVAYGLEKKMLHLLSLFTNLLILGYVHTLTILIYIRKNVIAIVIQRKKWYHIMDTITL